LLAEHPGASEPPSTQGIFLACGLRPRFPRLERGRVGTMKTLALGLFVVIASVAGGGIAASAVEIKLLTAGAMRTVVVALLPDFEKREQGDV
jgi:hypothetical protein